MWYMLMIHTPWYQVVVISIFIENIDEEIFLWSETKVFSLKIENHNQKISFYSGTAARKKYSRNCIDLEIKITLTINFN